MFKNAGLKYIYEKIDNVLKIAIKHDGTPFGEYVCGVIAKVVVHDFSKIKLPTVSIWFFDEEDQTSFFTEAGLEETNGHYFYVDNFNDVLFEVAMQVSDVLTVDFDIDYLTWNVSTKKFSSGSLLHNTSFLLQCIREKRITLTKNYSEYPRDRLEEYEASGWTILDVDGNELS